MSNACLSPIAVAALILGAATAAAVETPADRDIRMWQQHVKRDPEDSHSPCNLGLAYLQKARESGEFEYYRKAEASFKRVLELEPDSRGGLAGLASACNSQHRFKEAIPVARRALELNPSDAAAMGILGDALLEAGEVAEASALYEKLLAAAPVPFSYGRMANLLWLKGDSDGAIVQLKNALATCDGQPAETTAWCDVQIGGICFARGDLDAAQSWYEQALKAFPDYFQARERVAELKGARGDFDGAAELYLALIKQNPRPDLQQALGDLYQFAGKTDEAMDWHQTALDTYRRASVDGGAHWCHHLSAFYCDVMNDGGAALVWAKKDLEYRQSIYAYDALAWACYKAGSFKEAAEAMDKALALGTQDAHLFSHAGLIHARAGDFAKGSEYMKKALTVNPAFEKFHVHR